MSSHCCFFQTLAALFGTLISPTFSQKTCPAGCASLDFLAGLAGLTDNCLCITRSISGLQDGLRSVLAVRQGSQQQCIFAKAQFKV
jgi:hypothetical protein